MTRVNVFKATALLFLSGICCQGYSQGNTLVMSLEECLSYAKEHSITLKQKELNLDDYKIEVESAKSKFLPSVSGSVSQSMTNTPFKESQSGFAESVTKSSYSGSYGANMSMTLYKGGENALSLKQSKLYTQIGELGIKEAENSIELSITQVYVEILYAIDMIEVAKVSLELSLKNIERGDVMLKVGSMNEADYAQLVTNEATARYNLVAAQTSLRNKYVELKQLLEITDSTELRIDTSELNSDGLTSSIPSVGEVYLSAMDIRPEIAARSLYVESAKINKQIAKAGFLPTLSLSAGIGINHSTNSSYTFSDQLNNNYNHSVGLNLSIPIFSRFENRQAVAKSKNAIKYAALSYDEESKNLYKTIETLHNNAQNAKAMYVVSKSKLEALTKSLALVTKQYEVGAKNIIELLTEQSDLRESSQEYLESKYTLIYNIAILEFYKSGIIKL
ncbi:MAG: TolC family protein [Rikenellaceae bacterium]